MGVEGAAKKSAAAPSIKFSVSISVVAVAATTLAVFELVASIFHPAIALSRGTTSVMLAGPLELPPPPQPSDATVSANVAPESQEPRRVIVSSFADAECARLGRLIIHGSRCDRNRRFLAGRSYRRCRTHP